jgi:hypothetical protein
LTGDDSYSTPDALRLGPEQAVTALKQPHVREFGVTGRSMRGWALFEADRLESNGQLAERNERALIQSPKRHRDFGFVWQRLSSRSQVTARSLGRWRASWRLNRRSGCGLGRKVFENGLFSKASTLFI